MAANFESCNLNQLLIDAAGFRDSASIFENNREAIDVRLRILALAAAGGTDYSADATGFEALVQAAASWIAVTRAMTCDERQAVNLQLDIQNAINDGATVPTNINTLTHDSRKALQMPKEARRNLLLYLKCQINALNKPE